MNILLVEDEERVANFHTTRPAWRRHGPLNMPATVNARSSFWPMASTTLPFWTSCYRVFPGVDLCRRIRARGNHLPVLMLSALGRYR